MLPAAERPDQGRSGTSGEGMKLRLRLGYGPRFGYGAHARTALLHAAVGVGLAMFVLGFDAPAARAQGYASESLSDSSTWTKIMRSLGLGREGSSSDIKYSERSPLVVPPTRDLPPPVAAPPETADWPRQPNVRHRHTKSNAVVPPAATANLVTTGSVGAPGEPAPSVQAVQPPPTHKSFFNPSTWFNKEEYAPFTGEPVRTELTDPPIGYRTPSPTHPYGIGPDHKGPPVRTAGNPTQPQTATQAPTQPGAPAGSQTPAQQPTAPAAPQPASPVAAQPGAPMPIGPGQ